MQLILASRSPRRRELLSKAGYQFAVDPPSELAEQLGVSQLAPIEFVAALAYQKAREVATRTERGLVLAADTVAECRGQILGKPRDRHHARDMLEILSGQVHYVHTGVCLWSRPDDRQLLKTDTTELEMDLLVPDQIEQYLESGLWQGKAGAFGYQDDLPWIRIRHGSSSNVVGLPMELLQSMLSEFEIHASD